MLGRRAAVGLSVAVLTVTGGSVAFAATHGSSHSTKPQVTPKHHSAPAQRMRAPAVVRAEHHCSHSAPASADL
jgi:hypothetical protein